MIIDLFLSNIDSVISKLLLRVNSFIDYFALCVCVCGEGGVCVCVNVLIINAVAVNMNID